MKLPKNYGSILRLKGNRAKPYGVIITVGRSEEGKQLRKYIGYFKSKREAMKHLEAYNKQGASDYITLKQLFAYHMERIEGKHTKRSLSNKKVIYKAIKSIEDKNINEIKASEFISLINKYNNLKQLRLRHLLTQLEREAKRRDLKVLKLSEYIEPTRETLRKQREAFTRDEIELLWNNSDTVKTVLILIYTGLRIGEFLTLDTFKIDLEKMEIRHGIKTANGKNRIIPINSKITNFITYFYNNINLIKNLQYTTFLYRYKKEMKRLGIKRTIHETRHTFATLMHEAGSNIINTAKIMGHSSGRITARVYTHIGSEILRSEIEKI